MALNPLMRTALEEVTDALKDYAARKGWGPDDYRILAKVNEPWSLLHVVFAARDLPGPDDFAAWKEVEDHINSKVDINQYINSLGVVVTTLDQVGGRGLYAIGPQFIDVKELLPAGASA